MKGGIKLLLFAVFYSISITSQGQSSTLISYEVGPNNHFANFNSQSEIDYRPSKEGVPGIVVTQQVFKDIYIESGVYNNFFGFDMIYTGTTDTSNLIFAQEQLNIPLRLQFRHAFLKNHLVISMTTGANFVFGVGDNTYTFYSSNNYDIETNNLTYKDSYTLLEFGIGANVFIGKHFFFGVNYRLNKGFNEMFNLTATSNEQNVNYKLSSTGDYHALMFSIGYRISQIWNKK